MQKAKTIEKDRKALDRLQSPDDLDRYLRMTTSGIWISIIACAAILLGIGASSLHTVCLRYSTATGYWYWIRERSVKKEPIRN